MEDTTRCGHGTARSATWALSPAYDKKDGEKPGRSAGMGNHFYDGLKVLAHGPIFTKNS